MRRLTPELIDVNYPDQEIADTVNGRRTQQSQGALAELGTMAPSSWRRNYLPVDPAPYDANDVRQYRQTRVSTSTLSWASGSQPVPFHPTSSSLYGALGDPHALAPGQPPGPTTARQTALQLSNEELLGIVRQRHYPQDFDRSGPPPSSGYSVDSRATGSAHLSMYSNHPADHWALPQGEAQRSRYHHSSSASSRTSGQGKTRAAPYPPTSTSDSGTAAVKPANCRHKPGGPANPAEFIGCHVTDDELKQGGDVEKKARNRLRVRKRRHENAENLGVSMTGKAQQHERDARAARKGFSTRQQSRQAERDARAVRQLGECATGNDLGKNQAGERTLAKNLGVSVDEICRQRRILRDSMPADAFFSGPNQQRTPDPDADGSGMTQAFRVGV